MVRSSAETFFFVVLLLSLFAGRAAAAEPVTQRPAQSSAPAQRPAASPLAAEMKTLDSVMRDMVSAIAEADGVLAVKAVDSMREPGEKTHQALRAGTVSLPKNGDRMDEFQRSYDSFHAHIEALGRAGTRNNVEAMLMLTKQLLENCVTCHRTYRK